MSLGFVVAADFLFTLAALNPKESNRFELLLTYCGIIILILPCEAIELSVLISKLRK